MKILQKQLFVQAKISLVIFLSLFLTAQPALANEVLPEDIAEDKIENNSNENNCQQVEENENEEFDPDDQSYGSNKGCSKINAKNVAVVFLKVLATLPVWVGTLFLISLDPDHNH
ncbi:MAG: hypothetical protein VW455_11480 [Nitrospinota bacterium]